MPKQQYRYFVAALALLCLSGCEREHAPTYEPNGPYVAQRKGGKRFVVMGPDGARVAKLRIKSSGIKVYGVDMLPLGKVVRTDDGISAHLRDRDEPVALVETDAGVELSQYFRAESVADGWVIFGPDAETLGYVALNNGEWQFRDDYSSAPIRVARANQRFVEVPGGANFELTRSDVSPSLALAMTLTDLDPVARTVLGIWLEIVGEGEGSATATTK